MLRNYSISSMLYQNGTEWNDVIVYGAAMRGKQPRDGGNHMQNKRKALAIAATEKIKPLHFSGILITLDPTVFKVEFLTEFFTHIS